jgi:cytochrome P450
MMWKTKIRCRNRPSSSSQILNSACFSTLATISRVAHLLYSYLLLSRHLVALSKVRAEHDEVFGSDFSLDRITRAITDEPTLLNQLPYTLVAIKEVLRIFRPVGSMRYGRPDLFLTDEQGQRYPTEGCTSGRSA